MKNILIKTLTGSLTSAARSLISSEIKKTAKNFFGKKPKTPEQIENEIINSLGYSTQHYKVDKSDKIIYKSSALFLYEWLTCHPDIKNSLIKDEENGQVYFKGKLITNQDKVELLNKFSKSTNINSASLSGHFDAALKLIDVSDYTSIIFKKHFKGWDPSSPSIIDGWLKNIYGTGLATDEQYATLLFKKWIVGTALRAMQPGSSLDGCLTLQGPAGAGKTRFFRFLLPEPFDKRTGEIYCNIKHPQKFVEAIIGKTIACFDELSVLDYQKTEEVFKQLLTSQFIDTRLVWRKDPQRYLLRQGFAATSNKEKFIKDQFLSRRLWTISLNKSDRINFEYLEKNKKALWMEAVYLATHGFSSHLSIDEQKMVDENNKKYQIEN